MRVKALAAGLILSWATASLAQSAPPVFKFEMHGFASGTVFVQDGSLAPSQGNFAYLPNVNQPTEDKLSTTVDARQSRFNFSVTGPQVFGGAVPKGVMELDWLGEQGAGNGGTIHYIPRLRVAYSELNWGTHRLVFGQNYDLLAALGPVTLSHLGAPYHLAAGNLGFRRPGVFGYHAFGDVKNPNGMKYEFAWEVGRAQWTDAATTTLTSNGQVISAAGTTYGCTGNIASNVAPPAGSAANVCAGEASGLPAVQARFSVAKGSMFSLFVAGHWNKVDRNGAGNIDPSDKANGGVNGRNMPLDVIGGNGGLKLALGPVTIAGGGYVGKNLAPLYGGMGASFYTAAGDVHEYGVWGQAGFNFTKELSVWQFMGVDRITDNDLPNSLFPINRTVAAASMLQYRDGGYAIGLEWMHWRSVYTAAGGAITAAQAGLKIVNQFALTGIYFF